jgi:pilus assembly protein CpaB
MNRRFVAVLLFALVVSATASVILYRLIAAKLTASAGAPTKKIVVAARNIEIGAVVGPADVVTSDWAGDPPMGSFTGFDDVLNRGVVSNIYAGEAVLDTRLAPKGAGGGLAATIPPGMRAVAIRVNEVVGVSGFVLPGMHVDILIAGNPPGQGNSTAGTLTRTLLQNIEVLSAGSNIQRDNEGKPISVPVVNLLVTPEQAETLSLASTETRIQLVLRNPLDKEIAKPPGTAVANLFTGGSGVPELRPVSSSAPAPRPRKMAPKEPPPPPPPPVVVVAPPPPPPPPPPITVEVFHGVKKTETSFPGQEKKP